MRSRRQDNRRLGSGRDKGAVAVEFALVMPVLLILVLGIFEFGRIFNIQVSLSQAARESTRYAAVHAADTDFSIAKAQAAGVAAAPAVPLRAEDVVITYSSGSACGPGVNVISTVSYAAGFMTGLDQLIGVPQSLTIKGKGAMRCGG